ncbi:hypothetical protein B0H13DRAFT_2321563 [Mycena leptocephala]|nr:hypothetical protein B0H13DRAFT_2321563 [Mycena leptocephala]
MTRKVYKSRDVTFVEHGTSSGWIEVITDLRNIPPITPDSPVPGSPSITAKDAMPLPADVVDVVNEPEMEKRDEPEDAGAGAEDLAEVVVEAPPVPRTRRLPLRFEGMRDERAKLPKGRYQQKAAPETVDAPELEEEEEFQAQARAARVPESAIPVPLTFRQAMASADSEEWANAMEAEFGSLVDTGTFDYVDAPEGRRVVTCKWVMFS